MSFLINVCIFQFVNFNLAHKCTSIINFYTDVSSGARGIPFSQEILLRPYFVYASSKSSDETVRMRRLV